MVPCYYRTRQIGTIVCLTRVWQSLLPLFCDKTFEFVIQTWQTSLEHYYVYVKTNFLSQLRKMLILLISFSSKTDYTSMTFLVADGSIAAWVVFFITRLQRWLWPTSDHKTRTQYSSPYLSSVIDLVRFESVVRSRTHLTRDGFRKSPFPSLHVNV